MSSAAKRQKTIHDVSNQVDGIKEKLTDQEYKSIMDSLGQLHAVEEESAKNNAKIAVRITYCAPMLTLPRFNIDDGNGTIDVHVEQDLRIYYKKAIVCLPRDIVKKTQDQIEQRGFGYLMYSDVNGEGANHHMVLEYKHPDMAQESKEGSVTVSTKSESYYSVVFLDEL